MPLNCFRVVADYGVIPMFNGLVDRMDDVTPGPGKEKVAKTVPN